MKKLIAGSIMASMLVVPAMAQDVSVYLNSERMIFDQNPIIENGRTLVPLRSIFEGLGAEVKWNPDIQEIKGITSDKEVVLRVGETSATVNGNTVTLDVPAKIENGRTLVPLRFISESLDAEVKWNAEEYRIDIIDEDNNNLDVLTEEEKYEYILKENNKNNNDCLIEKMDIDFDGVEEFIYYPEKVRVYGEEIQIYGGKDFSKLNDFGKNLINVEKIQLLENIKTKEVFVVFFNSYRDEYAVYSEGIDKVIKDGNKLNLQQIFLHQGDENFGLEEFLIEVKQVSEEEYKIALEKFNQEHRVINSFEIPNEESKEIKIEYKLFEETIKDDKTGQELLVIEYKYPQFEEKNELLKSLNKKYNDNVDLLLKEKEKIIKYAQNYNEKTNGTGALPFRIYNDIEVTYNNNNIISIVNMLSDWWGEEFPVDAYDYNTENYNIVTGKELILKDIMTNKSQEEIENMLNKKFEEEYNMEIDMSYVKFYLTDNGIMYNYNGHYEVGPYEF